MSTRSGSARRRSEIEELLADTRPLTARSVAATALLGSHDGRLSVSDLVQVGSLFGIGDGAIRTALWRMVANGELTTDDGRYALAGPLLDRRARVDESANPTRRPWDGSWELAVVSAESRPARDRLELRHAAVALHLAELREGVWTRPDNLDPGRHAPLQEVVDAQCVRFRGASTPSDVAGQIFELDEWTTRARVLLDALTTDERGRVDSPRHLRHGFLLSVTVVRHLQADPLLPDELLPDDWVGDDLREAYTTFERDYQHRLSDAVEHRTSGN